VPSPCTQVAALCEAADFSSGAVDGVAAEERASAQMRLACCAIGEVLDRNRRGISKTPAILAASLKDPERCLARQAESHTGASKLLRREKQQVTSAIEYLP
jgi:hypothetical protein